MQEIILLDESLQNTSVRKKRSIPEDVPTTAPDDFVYRGIHLLILRAPFSAREYVERFKIEFKTYIELTTRAERKECCYLACSEKGSLSCSHIYKVQ